MENVLPTARARAVFSLAQFQSHNFIEKEKADRSGGIKWACSSVPDPRGGTGPIPVVTRKEVK